MPNIHRLCTIYSNLFITSRERWRNFIFTPVRDESMRYNRRSSLIGDTKDIFFGERKRESGARGGGGISSSRHICREGGNTWGKFARILRAEGIIPDGARRERERETLSLSLTSKYRGPDLGISKCEGRGRIAR